jgi:hypothetical protein
MPGSAVQRARAMECQHPPEERQPVYEGTAVARTDRTFCGLCGRVIYVSDSRFTTSDSAGSTKTPAVANERLRAAHDT